MNSALSVEEMKERAAKSALELISDGEIVGLGSGTTVEHFVKALASSGVKVSCVPSSKAIERLARRLGLEVLDLNEVEKVDVTVDGADEVDPEGNMIKGYGGALLGEKVLASSSNFYAIIVDERKIVKRLGERGKLPVEVVKYGWKKTQEKLGLVLGPSTLRGPPGDPFETDHGNYILDVVLREFIENPEEVELKVNAIPGVVENGIFCGISDLVIVAYRDGRVEKIEYRVPKMILKKLLNPGEKLRNPMKKRTIYAKLLTSFLLLAIQYRQTPKKIPIANFIPK